ncbi:DUF317 domain-containing protein [Streptomyces sp. NBC_00825]|uniref:DUF317 domain-containing protein n=1 Tax=unclassified Streptomyces TaxID=2593676 RepID=UPI002ED0A21A|nr:DUF317 domain-containing protein [Streptomyces sp. NBC_00826]WTH89220.1 DUF317 domain-containing protein [Streptomyces sp. NBC_00825]WTH97945.1 DUF317 domain-containing protein [Streptomyces sp. NBC_00822]
MPPDPFNDLDPDQTVSVLPRYLAGPGTLDLHTVWPFPFDDGWHLHPADEGMVFASSPCARLWTRFVPEPDKRNKGTWTISANRVPFGQLTWQINFDATTPVELLHDVHAELLDLSSDQERLFEDVTAHYEAYWPLFAPGWSHHVKTDGTLTFLAPDGLGSVSHQYATTGSDEPIWQAGGGHPTEPHWTASFSPGTPATLVAAFTASLTSTEPLHRAVKNIPYQTRSHLYVPSTTAKQPPGHSPTALPPAAPEAGRTR